MRTVIWWLVLSVCAALYLWAAIAAWQLAGELGAEAMGGLAATDGHVGDPVASQAGMLKRVTVLCQLTRYVVVLSAVLASFLAVSLLARRARSKGEGR